MPPLRIHLIHRLTLPTSVDPVKDIVATRGSLQNSEPISATFFRLHETTLNTPLGIPALWAS